MKFLPFESIIYKTSLKEDEIISRLSEIVETEKFLGFGLFRAESTKSYEGYISGHYFKIHKIIMYRNSFLPQIKGIIERTEDGILIKVKMRMYLFVIIFVSLWCSLVGTICVGVLRELLFNFEFSAVSIVPLIMFSFAYGLTMGGFKYESIKSKRELQKIFEAEIIKE